MLKIIEKEMKKRAVYCIYFKNFASNVFVFVPIAD